MLFTAIEAPGDAVVTITETGGDDQRIATVLRFWKEAGPDRWFSKDDAFDRTFTGNFLDLHMAAAARRLDPWMETPDGALALLILTDQFPRNAFRDTGHMFATDPLALFFARHALAVRYMDGVDPELSPFFGLPFMHSEDLADQDVSVALNEGFGEPWLPHAKDHREIVRRFGRFPHRNPVLGRETTAAETAFLEAGGFQG
ncbi:MAG: hypothetical protein CMM50_13115 [Rhodospirillaceae bacterium]|nr:hypothetical protein [Rhodospirillaceae bacterium]